MRVSLVAWHAVCVAMVLALDGPQASGVLRVEHGVDRHPRGLFDSIVDLFNPDRQARADESSSGNDDDNDDDNSDNVDNSTDNNDSTDRNTDNTDNTDNDDSTDRNTDNTDNTDRSSENTDRSSENTDRSTENTDEPSTSSRESSSRPRPSSESERPTDSSSERPSSSDPTSSDRTSSDRTSSSESPSPTSSETSDTSMEVVTVTRPGVTRTTLIGPAPTIDQQDGNKADVGASGNQTSIIVATVVTAVALLLCTVLYYLYKRRKKSLQHGDDGFFAKGGERANTISTASPFIPPSDGYVDARRTDEEGRSQFSANDNTHLLAPQQGARYQQQQMGMVSAPMAPMVSVPMVSVPMAPMTSMAPMAPMGQGSPPNRYTSQPQPNMHATGYAPQPHSMRANTGYDASLHPAPRPPILQSNVFSPQQHHNMR